MKPETLKPIEENIGNPQHDITVGKEFPNRTLISQELRPIIDKWDLLKLKCVSIAKETTNPMKKKLTE